MLGLANDAFLANDVQTLRCVELGCVLMHVLFFLFVVGAVQVVQRVL
jgi:hypothetical protein